MAKFCTNCGKELDDNAALCLNCGKLVENNAPKSGPNQNNKKKGFPTWAIVLIIVGCVIIIPFIIFLVAGITAYNIIKDNGVDINDWYTNTRSGTIGDTLEIEDIRLTLNDALRYDYIEGPSFTDTPAENKEYLVFFLTAQNISDDTLYIYDGNFSGYADDRYVPIATIRNNIDGNSTISERIFPHQKSTGYVAFEVDTDWQEFSLYYREDFDDLDEIVFTVVKGDDEDNTNNDSNSSTNGISA